MGYYSRTCSTENPAQLTGQNWFSTNMVVSTFSRAVKIDLDLAVVWWKMLKHLQLTACSAKLDASKAMTTVCSSTVKSATAFCRGSMLTGIESFCSRVWVLTLCGEDRGGCCCFSLRQLTQPPRGDLLRQYASTNNSGDSRFTKNISVSVGGSVRGVQRV